MGRLKTTDFDYYLPKKHIAQNPLPSRDMSKLLVFDTEKNKVFHKNFHDIVSFLKSGDTMVVNKSMVIPARITFGNKEIFLLRKLTEASLKNDEMKETQADSVPGKLHENTWSCLVRPGKFFTKGKNFPIMESMSAEILGTLSDTSRIIRFSDSPEKFGQIPLPPYIKNSKASLKDYQTIFAKKSGSVAAPTAGLHFTSKLTCNLQKKGVTMEEILLHVGLGTFSPVRTNFVDEHKMHSEYFELSENTAHNLNGIKQSGGKIFAVGTTTVRVLESCFENVHFVPKSGDTEIFFYPRGGHNFKCVDSLITNFHLPKSTLIMLVAAFLEKKGVIDGRRKILELYEIAKKHNYRFYSFGDAMLII